jgi:glycosyltransferase involved in cell wall biosynthesis
MTPAISVVFPVGDRLPFLEEALDSVLAQGFTDFELIAVLDGVGDAVTRRRDDRVRIVDLPVNMGLSNARNTGLKLARAPYIALMDSDDVALPQRLATQHAWLEANPEVTVLGTSAIKLQGEQRLSMHYPETDGQIKARLLRVDGVIIDPTSMYRTQFVRRAGIWYDSGLPRDQDHRFWVDMMRAGARFHALRDELLLYRRHDSNLTVDRTHVDIEKSRVREALLPLFFPELSGHDYRVLVKGMREKVEMTFDEACHFLTAINRALQEGRSFYGEDRTELRSLLAGLRLRVAKSIAGAQA